MNEQQIAHRIRQLLNKGLDLDAGKLSRLKVAREQALARQRVRAPVFVLDRRQPMARFADGG